MDQIPLFDPFSEHFGVWMKSKRVKNPAAKHDEKLAEDPNPAPIGRSDFPTNSTPRFPL